MIVQPCLEERVAPSSVVITVVVVAAATVPPSIVLVVVVTVVVVTVVLEVDVTHSVRAAAPFTAATEHVHSSFDASAGTRTQTDGLFAILSSNGRGEGVSENFEFAQWASKVPCSTE